MHATHRYRSQRTVWKGAVAGLAGGLAAAWTMNRFQSALAKMAGSNGQAQGDDATMKAASAISETIAHRPLSRRQKEVGGPLVHYAFGTAVGAMYGVAAEMAPSTADAWGLPFGAAVWLGADEIGVPAAGLSGSAADAPLAAHASALAAHLVYGLTADVVRRLVRAALTSESEPQSRLPF